MPDEAGGACAGDNASILLGGAGRTAPPHFFGQLAGTAARWLGRAAPLGHRCLGLSMHNWPAPELPRSAPPVPPAAPHLRRPRCCQQDAHGSGLGCAVRLEEHLQLGSIPLLQQLFGTRRAQSQAGVTLAHKVIQFELSNLNMSLCRKHAAVWAHCMLPTCATWKPEARGCATAVRQRDAKQRGRALHPATDGAGLQFGRAAGLLLPASHTAGPLPRCFQRAGQRPPPALLFLASSTAATPGPPEPARPPAAASPAPAPPLWSPSQSGARHPGSAQDKGVGGGGGGGWGVGVAWKAVDGCWRCGVQSGSVDRHARASARQRGEGKSSGRQAQAAAGRHATARWAGPSPRAGCCPTPAWSARRALLSPARPAAAAQSSAHSCT